MQIGTVTDTLRRMQAADIPAVVAIDAATSIDPWSAALFADCLTAGYLAWVIEDPQAGIVAFSLLSMGANEAHIINLAVALGHQRRGLATRLLQTMIEQARIYPATQIFLEVRRSNLPAQTLYRRFGFTQIGTRKGYYTALQGREDALVLAKPLVV